MSGFFRGAPGGSDYRFSNKEKAQLKAITDKAPPEYAAKVSMSRVRKAAFDSWIARRLTEYLGGVEDEISAGMVQHSLAKEHPDPREIQLLLTGVLEKKAQAFTLELWTALLKAQMSPLGVPHEWLAPGAAGAGAGALAPAATAAAPAPVRCPCGAPAG